MTGPGISAPTPGGARYVLSPLRDIQPIDGDNLTFSLPEACLAADIFRGDGAPRLLGPTPWHGLTSFTSERLTAYAERQWSRSIPLLLRDAGVRAFPADLPPPPPSLGRAAIGGRMNWHGRTHRFNAPEPFRVICSNVALCVTILSRCTGQVYLSARETDYDWDHLMSASIWLEVKGVRYQVLSVVRRTAGIPVRPLLWHCRYLDEPRPDTEGVSE